MIYFIQCGENGPIKIGYTQADPKHRLKQLQIGCPYKLKLIFVYQDNDRESESDIHAEFEDYRMRGEWFLPTGRIYDFIDAVAGIKY